MELTVATHFYQIISMCTTITIGLTNLVGSSVCFRLLQGHLQPFPHDLVAIHALYGTLSRRSVVVTDKTWRREGTDCDSGLTKCQPMQGGD